MSSPLKWLCRTEKNEILGPMTIEEVRARILEKKLGPEDEVCASGEYWFAIKETEEVRHFLGIDPPIDLKTIPEGATQAITKTAIQQQASTVSSPSHLTSENSQKPQEAPPVRTMVKKASSRPPRKSMPQPKGLGGAFWFRWMAFLLGFFTVLVFARIYIMSRGW
jgi:hypothetical protein